MLTFFSVEEKYPELAKKMSCVQTGYFMSSYKLAPAAYFAKVSLRSHFTYALSDRFQSYGCGTFGSFDVQNMHASYPAARGVTDHRRQENMLSNHSLRFIPPSFKIFSFATSTHHPSPSQQPNNTYIQSFPTPASAPVPHLAVNADLGTFVHGVVQMGPGKHYMAAGTTCSWADFVATWSKVTGKEASYRQCSVKDLAENSPDRWFGEEIADMFEYSG